MPVQEKRRRDKALAFLPKRCFSWFSKSGSMEPSDDMELMLRVRDGQDAGAFEELMHRYQRPLVGFLMRLTGNLDAAQDLAEETFVRIWQSAPRYRPSAKFPPWLFTLASRLATDHARRPRVRWIPHRCANWRGRGQVMQIATRSLQTSASGLIPFPATATRARGCP